MAQMRLDLVADCLQNDCGIVQETFILRAYHAHCDCDNLKRSSKCFAIVTIQQVQD